MYVTSLAVCVCAYSRSTKTEPCTPDSQQSVSSSQPPLRKRASESGAMNNMTTTGSVATSPDASSDTGDYRRSVPGILTHGVIVPDDVTHSF